MHAIRCFVPAAIQKHTRHPKPNTHSHSTQRRAARSHLVHEARALEVVLQNNLLACVEHSADVARVRSARKVVVHLRGARQRFQSIPKPHVAHFNAHHTFFSVSVYLVLNRFRMYVFAASWTRVASSEPSGPVTMPAV